MKNEGMNIRFWLFLPFIAVCALGIVMSAGAQENKFRLKPGAQGKNCLTCHVEFQDKLKLPSVHTPVKSGECVSCHNPPMRPPMVSFWLRIPIKSVSIAIPVLYPKRHSVPIRSWQRGIASNATTPMHQITSSICGRPGTTSVSAAIRKWATPYQR